MRYYAAICWDIEMVPCPDLSVRRTKVLSNTMYCLNLRDSRAFVRAPHLNPQHEYSSVNEYFGYID